MKALLLFILPICLFAQDIPKGANAIIIASNLSDNELYKIAGQTLINEGYTIKSSDKDFLTIQTDAKKIKGVNAYPRIVISVNNNKIKLSGYFGTSIDNDPNTELTKITKRGMRGSPFMEAFGVMLDFANKLNKSVDGTMTFEIDN